MEPKLEVDVDGYQYWYLKGKLHREDGPALIYPSGYEAWFLNGLCHREDGPAVIHSNNKSEYWAFGVIYDSLEELQIGITLDG